MASPSLYFTAAAFIIHSEDILRKEDNRMIRTILALIFVFLFLILGIPVLFVEWIIGKFNKPAADLSSLRIVQWAFRVILFICGTKITVIGEENVPKDTPVLYIGNHRSYFDIIITYARCPGLTGYVAKDNIARVPLFKPLDETALLPLLKPYRREGRLKNDPYRS